MQVFASKHFPLLKIYQILASVAFPTLKFTTYKFNRECIAREIRISLWKQNHNQIPQGRFETRMGSKREPSRNCGLHQQCSGRSNYESDDLSRGRGTVWIKTEILPKKQKPILEGNPHRISLNEKQSKRKNTNDHKGIAG